VLHLIKFNTFIYVVTLLVVTITMILVGASLQTFGLRAFTIAGILGSFTAAMVYFGWRWVPGFSRWVFGRFRRVVRQDSLQA
jgi:hypothetical protein